MAEREEFPTDRALHESRQEHAAIEQRGPQPGRIQRWDAATQTADVVPLIRQQVPQPDGSYNMEAGPVVPSVPVLLPRVAGWFLGLPVTVGDMVLLIPCESAIGHWRAGDGSVTDPGDLRRHHLSHCVAIPGLYPRSRALAGVSTADLIIGKDDGHTVIRITSAGAITIDATSGQDVTINGGTAKVNREGDAVDLGSWTFVPGTGGASLSYVPPGAVSPTTIGTATPIGGKTGVGAAHFKG